jgi:hypothetical protein
MSVWTGRDTKRISYSDGWVAVKDNAVSAAQRAKQKAAAETLDADSHNRSTRSVLSAIFSPSAGGVVRPETFAIRWNPEEGVTGTIAISVWQPMAHFEQSTSWQFLQPYNQLMGSAT